MRVVVRQSGDGEDTIQAEGRRAGGFGGGEGAGGRGEAAEVLGGHFVWLLLID